MINILFEELPDAVEVSGKFYKIATDFRDSLALFFAAYSSGQRKAA